MISRRNLLAGLGVAAAWPGAAIGAERRVLRASIALEENRVLVAVGMVGKGPYIFMIDTGGVVSLIMKGGHAAAARFVDAVTIPKIAASLGGVESLIEQPAIMSYFGSSPDALAELGIDPGLVRIAVGIEECDDLVADVMRAVSA